MSTPMPATTAMASPPAVSPVEWSLGVPGALIRAPPSRVRFPLAPAPLDKLAFTPGGAFDLRRHLGVKSSEFFELFKDKLLAADLALLASGASKDDKHLALGPDEVFQEFHNLYQSLPVGEEGYAEHRKFLDGLIQLIFDLVTKWDRVTGGTTIVIHTPGATAPKVAPVPEQLKAVVHLSPRFIHDHPEAHASIAFLVQTYIEKIGVPTAHDWVRRVTNFWPLSRSLDTTRRRNFAHLPLIPNPVKNTTLRVFRGRPEGQLILQTPAPIPLEAPAAIPPTADSPNDAHEAEEDDIGSEAGYGEMGITFDRDACALLDALEKVEQLEAENRSLRDTITSLQEPEQTIRDDAAEQIESLNTELEMSFVEVCRLEFQTSEREQNEKEYVVRIQQLEDRLQRTEEERATLATRQVLSPPRSPAPRPRSQRPQVTPSRSEASTRFGSPFISVSGSPRPHAASARVLASGMEVPASSTDRYLADHGLKHLRPAIDVIVRAVSVLRWSEEVRNLPDLDPQLFNGLLDAMDNDREM
ncbi:hypothetical protein C8R45DRAFT_1100696 [Mycena sanguinolenta]|nr:hypothetical protein C8R45DRAFT_1100696 [Mycena sanguinolenta]